MSKAVIDKLSLLKGKKPREGAHAVVLDHEAVDAYARARQRLTAAQGELRKARRLNEPAPTMAELQADVDEKQSEADALEAAGDDGVVEVKLRAMPPLAYSALRAEFPPTEDDHARVRANLNEEKAKAAWNESDFAPRLVAACVTDPDGVDEDTARGWQTSWGEPDWVQLVHACMRLHEQTVDTSSLVFKSGRTRN